MDRYFDEIMNILDSKSFSPQNRNMVQELINLRQNNWVPSHESEAKKITGKLTEGDVIPIQNTSSEILSSNTKKNLPRLPSFKIIT